MWARAASAQYVISHQSWPEQNGVLLFSDAAGCRDETLSEKAEQAGREGHGIG
jgi:hypothetical protein